MGNPLVDAAVEGLRLMGVPVPPTTFLELLINEGEDVLSVVPRLVSTIGALGGDAWQVLEEVASGMEMYGPVGYAQSLLDKHFAPAIQTVQDIHRSKTPLINTHRAMLTNITTRLITLAPQNGNGATHGQVTAFTGEAANAMNASFADISAKTSSLLNVMDQSQQIDQDLMNQLKIVMVVAEGMAILDIALLAIGLILTPFTAGGSLAIGLIVDGGLLGAEVDALLAAVIGCFVIWAVRHAVLAISTSLSQSHTPATGVKSGTTVNMARAHQEQLPKSGDRPYIPPKKGRGQPVWDANKGGFVDEYGNVWVWAKAKHGGDHWDVEHPDGSHTNVAPNGRVIGSSAKDKFPNKRK